MKKRGGIPGISQLSKINMQINIFTLFAVLYTATQINGQTTFLCECITNGVESVGATGACCGSVGGTGIGAVWLAPSSMLRIVPSLKM
jgi:hypothetical protein